MTAPINNSQMKIIKAETMSYRAPLLEAPHPTLLARLQAGIAVVLERMQRRAVLNELATLTDRELADIGLTRSELGRVFEQRPTQRHYA